MVELGYGRKKVYGGEEGRGVMGERRGGVKKREGGCTGNWKRKGREGGGEWKRVRESWMRKKEERGGKGEQMMEK